MGKFSLIRETTWGWKYFMFPQHEIVRVAERIEQAEWQGRDREKCYFRPAHGGLWYLGCMLQKMETFQRLLRRTLHSLVPVSGHSMVSHLYTVLSLTPFPSLECIHLLSWYHLWPRPNWNATLSSSSSLALSLTISLHFAHGPEAHAHYRWAPCSPEVFAERQWGLFTQHHPQGQFLSQYISGHFSFSLIFMQSPN